MINRLFILEGRNTPRVLFDPMNDKFEITGKSFPEHARKFYQPVFEWLNGFTPQKDSLTLHFKYHYISTASILVVSELLKTLAGLEKHGCRVKAVWHYDKDDDDLRATGEDLADLTQIPIDLIPS